MKKIAMSSIVLILAFISCQKEFKPADKGTTLNISATVTNAGNGARTTYLYSSGTQAGTITTNWEANEKITVVSIGEDGITAVDDFSSSGAAGREKAEFSGIWRGNEGDKLICLYPAVSTPAGSARYSGVEVGSKSISVNFDAHAPSQDIGSIKDYDLMIGDVIMANGTAHVFLSRKIAVIRLGVSGAYPYEYGVYARYIKRLGISVKSSSGFKLLASHATMKMEKSSYTGNWIPDNYYGVNRNSISQLTKEGTFYHYIPVLADGKLEVGDIISVYFTDRENSGTTWYGDVDKIKEKTLTESFSLSPGFVYGITADL